MDEPLASLPGSLFPLIRDNRTYFVIAWCKIVTHLELVWIFTIVRLY